MHFTNRATLLCVGGHSRKNLDGLSCGADAICACLGASLWLLEGVVMSSRFSRTIARDNPLRAGASPIATGYRWPAYLVAGVNPLYMPTR
jgi:hypothetical protein